MNRTELAMKVIELVGQDILWPVDLSNGWPAHATLSHPDSVQEPVSMYLASVGGSQRGRDDRERRIQVKGGHPIVDDGSKTLLLLGVWHEDGAVQLDRPVLFAADAYRRVGHTTQASIFVPLANLQEASRHGWSTYTSTTGETIHCFAPELLPTVVVALRDGVTPDVRQVQTTLGATGLLEAADPTDPATGDRARRSVQVLVRDAKFAKRVVEAYGDRCAMCGLDLGVTEGAHILPAAAANNDSPDNGLALCPTHHRLFDSHTVAVEPNTLAIRYHPELLASSQGEPVEARLIGATYSTLRPRQAGPEPDPQVFIKRYEYFSDHYDWLGL